MAPSPQERPPICVCKHSLAAHLGAARSCGFCSCPGFNLPEKLVPLDTGMSEQLMLALEILAKSSAFERVSGQHIADIGHHGRKRLFMAGDVLMVEGAAGDCLYFIVRGNVGVQTGIGTQKRRVVAQLGPGEFVGEMGPLLRRPRAATVTALSDLETLELDIRDLKAIFRDDHEILLGFVQIIQQRQHALHDLAG